MTDSEKTNAFEVRVYEDDAYMGAELIANDAIANLQDIGWNDRISSIKVISGTWRFWEHVNMSGRSWVLGPGYYAHPTQFPNDTISSFEPA